jgi:hypothetical protein
MAGNSYHNCVKFPHLSFKAMRILQANKQNRTNKKNSNDTSVFCDLSVCPEMWRRLTNDAIQGTNLNHILFAGGKFHFYQ